MQRTCYVSFCNSKLARASCLPFPRVHIPNTWVLGILVLVTVVTVVQVFGKDMITGNLDT